MVQNAVGVKMRGKWPLPGWLSYVGAILAAVLFWLLLNSRLAEWSFTHVDFRLAELAQLVLVAIGVIYASRAFTVLHISDEELAEDLRTAQGRLNIDIYRAADRTPENSESKEDITEAASSRVQPAWDVARATLSQYWNRNLNQNRHIFLVSVGVSCLGFAVTVWGVGVGLQNKAATSASIIAAASGALTQIIGTTLLFIFRSNAAQAKDFNYTLERINSVGMAWYILQTMSENTSDQVKAKNAAKATLVDAIIRASAITSAAEADE